jgi:zinc D-Ala-D-Ala dipeptidase
MLSPSFDCAAERRLSRQALKLYNKEWWHFTLRDEPFPDRYFDFPVR